VRSIGEHRRTFPADAGEDAPERILALRHRRDFAARKAFVAEDEEDERPVIAHRDARRRSSRRRVADIGELVARPIAPGLERGDVIAERDLERRFRTEGERAHARVQSVGADDEIGLALGRLVETDHEPIAALLDARHRVAEDRLDLALERCADRRRKIGALEARETVVRQAREYVDVEAAGLLAARVDIAHFLELIALCADPWDEAHLFGDVVADSPEVDDVAAAPKRRRLFDQDDVVPAFAEPPGERRSRDAGSVDDDSHACPRDLVTAALACRAASGSCCAASRAALQEPCDLPFICLTARTRSRNCAVRRERASARLHARPWLMLQECLASIDRASSRATRSLPDATKS
jgi:hypothetical protein